MVVQITPFTDRYLDQVLALWQQTGLTVPHNNPQLDIARKMAHSPELFLVAQSSGIVLGTLMCGYDGHRGWLNYLAVDPGYQRQGVARDLVDAAIERLQTLGCAKVNLQVRDGNSSAVAFYKDIGFNQDQVISLGRRLIQD